MEHLQGFSEPTDINGDGYIDYDVNNDGVIDLDFDGDGFLDPSLDGDTIPDSVQALPLHDPKVPKWLQDLIDEDNQYDDWDEPDNHYSAKGGHRERSIHHSPNHLNHWKKVDRGIRRIDVPDLSDVLPWVVGGTLLAGGTHLVSKPQPQFT